MSNDTNRKRPTHTAYSVRDFEANNETASDWTRIGTAWARRGGDGFDILLDAIPVRRRIVIRKAKPRPEQA